MVKIGTPSDNWQRDKFENNKKLFLELISKFQEDHEKIKDGGGAIAIEKQHSRKRLTARERIDNLIDPGTGFFELGIDPILPVSALNGRLTGDLLDSILEHI